MVQPTFWASPLPNGGVCSQGKKEGIGGGGREWSTFYLGNTQGAKGESRKRGLMKPKSGDPQGSQACQPEGKEVERFLQEEPLDGAPESPSCFTQ